MDKIEFTYSNNVFLDNGIIGLYRYLQDESKLIQGVNYDLEEKRLWVEHPDLPKLLEDKYYAMGRVTYDTYTYKQEQEGGNLFFRLTSENQIIEVLTFPKMNTYGFTELLTNNAAGKTSRDTNTKKIASIEKDDKSLAANIKMEFEKRKINLKSFVYFNEPYTKISHLETLSSQYLQEGKEACFLTGSKRKKLVGISSTSPFIKEQGAQNFYSFIKSSSVGITWEAMYLSRFSAATNLYNYGSRQKDNRKLNVYFVFSNNLINLDFLIFKDSWA